MFVILSETVRSTREKPLETRRRVDGFRQNDKKRFSLAYGGKIKLAERKEKKDKRVKVIKYKGLSLVLSKPETTMADSEGWAVPAAGGRTAKEIVEVPGAATQHPAVGGPYIFGAAWISLIFVLAPFPYVPAHVVNSK